MKQTICSVGDAILLDKIPESYDFAPIKNVVEKADVKLFNLENVLSDRKLKAAKKQLLGQLAISSDNGETQCLSMGKSLLSFGKIHSGKDNRSLVEGITAEEVRDMALKIFDRSRLSKLVYV